MMKQVNITMTDEDYEVLVVEAAKLQVESRKVYRVATLAYELLKPTIASLNGNTSPQDANQEETPETNSKDGEQLNNAFADLDI